MIGTATAPATHSREGGTKRRGDEIPPAREPFPLPPRHITNACGLQDTEPEETEMSAIIFIAREFYDTRPARTHAGWQADARRTRKPARPFADTPFHEHSRRVH